MNANGVSTEDQSSEGAVRTAGTFWEQHCDESVRAVGFEPIGEEWPSVYIREKLQLVLVVYVDDFKIKWQGRKRTLLKDGACCVHA